MNRAESRLCRHPSLPVAALSHLKCVQMHYLALCWFTGGLLAPAGRILQNSVSQNWCLFLNQFYRRNLLSFVLGCLLHCPEWFSHALRCLEWSMCTLPSDQLRLRSGVHRDTLVSSKKYTELPAYLAILNSKANYLCCCWILSLLAYLLIEWRLTERYVMPLRW